MLRDSFRSFEKKKARLAAWLERWMWDFPNWESFSSYWIKYFLLLDSISPFLLEKNLLQCFRIKEMKHGAKSNSKRISKKEPRYRTCQGLFVGFFQWTTKSTTKRQESPTVSFVYQWNTTRRVKFTNKRVVKLHIDSGEFIYSLFCYQWNRKKNQCRFV